MKIELQHEELEDAIALWLKEKLMDGTAFTVSVKHCNGLSANRGPARYTVEADARPMDGWKRPAAEDKAA